MSYLNNLINPLISFHHMPVDYFVGGIWQ